jgi:membrane-associated protein
VKFFHGLFGFFFGISTAVAVGLVFLFTSAETALLVGMIVPGEVVAILGGVLAGRGRVSYLAVTIAAVCGAWAGDSIGFLLGRKLGGTRFVSRRRPRSARARHWLKKKGGIAIFLARFTPFFRTIMPPAAGGAKMPYSRFLSWNLPSGALWGAVSTALGYVGERDLERVIRWSGRAGLLILAVVLLAALLVWRRLRPAGRVRRHRRRGLRAARARRARPSKAGTK